jgi:Tat protein translocase TatB subunit
MFGSLGGAELLLIFVIALLLFGPRKLPEIGRTIGRGMSEFRKATTEFKTSLEREVDLSDVKRVRDDMRQVRHEVGKSIKEARESVVPRDEARKPLGEVEKPANADGSDDDDRRT